MTNNPPLKNALVRNSCVTFSYSKYFREDQQLAGTDRSWEPRGAKQGEKSVLSRKYFIRQVTRFALWLNERQQK